jgi:hypothetical protein
VKLLKEEMDVKSLDQLPEVGTKLAQLTRSPSNIFVYPNQPNSVVFGLSGKYGIQFSEKSIMTL